MASDAVVTEPDLEALVEAVRADPGRRDELVPLLREDAALHRGRSTATTARLRGWVLAAFADVGLPAGAIPFVIEELTTGREPHLVAAAARATLGATDPDRALVRGLVEALDRIRDRDDAVTFEALAPSWPTTTPTTATTELLDALRALGPVAVVALPELRALARDAQRRNAPVGRALAGLIRELESRPLPPSHCCEPGRFAERVDDAVAAEPAGGAVDLDLQLQDQDGRRLTVGELLREPVTVVTFFYTRCPNPERCSATITNLARVQSLAGPAVGIAAVTYDPGYDTPARLRTYGAARGIRFGRTARLLRCPRDHDALARSFGLRVGYNGSVVNRHAIELHLVAADGRILQTWARVRWDPADVALAARRQLPLSR
jgi:protein SCO1/2